MKAEYTDRFGEKMELEIDARRDKYGRLDIRAWCDDGPYCDITVCFDESALLPEDVAYIDTNNEPGLYNWLQEIGVAKPTFIPPHSGGWHTYPAFKFNLDLLGM